MKSLEKVPKSDRSTTAGRLSAVGVTVLLGILVVATAVRAQRTPHWEGKRLPIDCTSQCHTPHGAAGGVLTQAATNVTLCQSCHEPAGHAGDLSVSDADKADRVNRTGISHAFDVLANQDFDGDGTDDVVTPTDPEMQLRVMGGNVVCSTCHNQHRSSNSPPYDFGGTPRIGLAKKVTTDTSPDIVSGGTFDGSQTGLQGVWYLVQIVTAGSETTAEFCYSKDNGISWSPTGCDPPGTTTPNLTANGINPVTLDSGVTVSFPTAGTYVLGEQWEFSAAWPFLRAKLDDSATSDGSVMCRDCHVAWEMSYTDVESWNGGSIKSHPVGVGLDANNRGYDRATPLDGNGYDGVTGSPDSNPSNDLTLDGNNQVQCLTCHGVHNVDSNTQTDDSR